MFATLLLAAGLTATPPFRLEGMKAGSDRLLLHRALNAPVRPRAAHQVHYCVRVTGSATSVARVCRTEQAWRDLGVMPLTS